MSKVKSKPKYSRVNTRGFKADQIHNQYLYGLNVDQQNKVRDVVESGRKIEDWNRFATEIIGSKPTKEQIENIKRFRRKVINGGGLLNFTDEEIEFVKNNGPYMSISDMAKAKWPMAEDRTRIRQTIGYLCQAFGINPPKSEDEKDGGLAESDYAAPDIKTLIAKINIIEPDVRLDLKSLTRQQKECLNVLKKNMASVRFVMAANAIKRKSLRRLFEDEFIKATWRKPELDSEDVNGYISLSNMYVRELELNETLRELDKELKEYDKDTADLHKKELYAIQKDKAAELNALQKEIANERSRLSGSREEKLKKRMGVEDRLGKFFLVAAKEEGRKIIEQVYRAEFGEQVNEIERLKNYSDLVAYVAGLSVDELINF